MFRFPFTRHRRVFKPARPGLGERVSAAVGRARPARRDSKVLASRRDWRLWFGLPAALVVVVAIVVALIAVRSSSGSESSSTQPSPAPTPPVPSSTPAPTTAPSGVAPPVVSKVPTTDPVVFFTIDDGLVRDPKVADFLERHKIPVTMFLVPEAAMEGEVFFERIQKVGASIQDHTQNHRSLTGLGPGAQQREVCGPVDEFQQEFGRRPWLFRPPNGFYNATTEGAVRVCGLRDIVLWTGATNDGRLDLQHPGGLQAGDIILMHFRPDLLENLQVALDAARGAGLRPAPLEQYLPDR